MVVDYTYIIYNVNLNDKLYDNNIENSINLIVNNIILIYVII